MITNKKIVKIHPELQFAEQYLTERGFPEDPAELHSELHKLGFVITTPANAKAQFPKLPNPLPKEVAAILLIAYHPTTRAPMGAAVVYISQDGSRRRVSEYKNNVVYYSRRMDWDHIPEGAVVYICESAIKAETLCRLGHYAIGLNGIRGYGDGAGGVTPMLGLLPWSTRSLRACVVFDSPSPTSLNNQHDLRHATGSVASYMVNVHDCRVTQIVMEPVPDEDYVNDKGSSGLDDYYHYHERSAEKITELLATEKEISTDISGARFRVTDQSNAFRLAGLIGQDVMFCDALGWLAWDGKRWVDGKDLVGKKVMTLSSIILAEAAGVLAEAAEAPPGEHRARLEALSEALRKWAKQSEMLRALSAAQKLLEMFVTVDVSVFESKPYLLNCANGTYDLKKKRLRPHLREDYLLNLIPLAYDPEAKCPQWDKFIKEVFQGNAEMMAFIRRVLGHALAGVTLEQKLFILFGPGGNGKSTLMEVVSRVYAHYGAVVPTSMIAKRRGRDVKDNDIADLHGKRLGVASETSDNCALAAEQVKLLTGGDRLKGRHLYKEAFEFDPSHSLFLITNYKPTVSADDAGLWRRMVLINMTAVFDKPDEAMHGDAYLKHRLIEEEGSGILAWLVAGWVDYRANGLGIPKQVMTAVAQYRSDEDRLADFWEECCIADVNGSAPAQDVVLKYQMWAKDSGYHALGKKIFKERLVEKYGLVEQKRVLKGLKLPQRKHI